MVLAKSGNTDDECCFLQVMVMNGYSWFPKFLDLNLQFGVNPQTSNYAQFKNVKKCFWTNFHRFYVTLVYFLKFVNFFTWFVLGENKFEVAMLQQKVWSFLRFYSTLRRD